MESIKRKVSPPQFEMFYLSVLKEIPVKEVAATLEVSAGRVYLAKRRISALLKNEVKKFGKKMV
jgi:DNA-directed RNA polymerase specialized sigma24 family protein